MKKKIMFVTASVTGGGAERMLINIINSLSLDNYDIMLINTSIDDAPKQLKSGVKYCCCNKMNASKSIWDIYKKISSFSPDYIFTTSSNIGYILVFLKLSSLKKFKVIIRTAVPPSESPLKGFKSNFVRFMSKLSYNRTDMIIAQTEFMKQDLVKSYKTKPDKIKVIRNIIDEEYLKMLGNNPMPNEYDDTNYNIVASGALYSIKGFDLLIKAYAEICKEIKNTHLYILGEERYERGYKQLLYNLIDKLGISQNVTLLGHKNNPYPYYKYANLFVMSSRKEGFPNVVLEALYFQTPVIATNCVDFNGVIIEGVNGYSVKKDSAQDLYIGLKKAMDELKKPCISELKNYDYNQIFI